MFLKKFFTQLHISSQKNTKHSFWYELLGYEPDAQSLAIYNLSLVHKINKHTASNERLEYLGDSVISLLIAERLYLLYPSEGEGFLTRARAKCVCRDNLNEIAMKMGLQNHLNVPQMMLQRSPDIHGNALEALVGAIYLDKGVAEAKRFVERYIIGDDNQLLKKVVRQELDYKSRLLEWGQAHKKQVSFEIINETYSSQTDTHSFLCSVKIDEVELAQAAGTTKLVAQQTAAKRAYENIDKYFLLLSGKNGKACKMSSRFQ